MTKVIGIVNQKGGVGKTTTANVLAHGLSKNYKVLLIDLDPQASLTSSLKINTESQSYTALEFINGNDENMRLLKITNNLYFIPADINLEFANAVLQTKIQRESFLKKAIDKIKDDFDYIVIDSSPTLSQLTINVLVASNELIIPTKAEYFSLKGIDLLLQTIYEIKEINKELNINGILITMFDSRRKRTDYAKEYIDMVANKIKTRVYKTLIRESVEIAELPNSKVDIEKLQNQDYSNFIKEFLENEHSK